MPTDTTTSPALTLNKADWKSIGTGALIAAGGALLTYLGPILLGIHYSFTLSGMPVDLTLIVDVLLSAGINAARKWITAHSTPTA